METSIDDAYDRSDNDIEKPDYYDDNNCDIGASDDPIKDDVVDQIYDEELNRETEQADIIASEPEEPVRYVYEETDGNDSGIDVSDRSDTDKITPTSSPTTLQVSILFLSYINI